MNKKITKGKLGDLIFQINPTEITGSVAGIYNEVGSPSMLDPIVVYGGGSNEINSFDLYLNSRHSNKLQRPIKDYIKILKDYTKQGKLVTFVYMGKSSRVIVESVDYTILGMNEKLEPIEANISLSLKHCKM